MGSILAKPLGVLVLLGLFVQTVSASLLINPTRVEFASSDRSTDVTLINTSEQTNTYRLEWVEKRATANGYTNLTEAEAAKTNRASPMIRFSPRQVTLRPGERQTIKLAVRRPQGLAVGEYRSHLQFKALAPPPKSQNTEAASTVVNIVLNFSIPVVIQQGALQYSVDASDARISYNPATKQGAVTVDMTRSGLHSVIGNINAYWMPAGGSEQLIGKLGDYNFWPEVTATTATLGWVGTPFAKSNGKLRIVYEGSKSFRGKTFFEKTFTINGGMIKTTD